MRIFCGLMLLLTATVAWAQSEPCLAGIDSPGCGIRITTNPPVAPDENTLWVPNQVTVEVPMRIRVTKVQVKSGPSGTATSNFKMLTEAAHFKKVDGMEHFVMEIQGCPGTDNAFEISIVSPKFPYPLGGTLGPFACKPRSAK